MIVRQSLLLGLLLAGIFAVASPVLAASPTTSVVAYSTIPMFATEDAAKAHCPSDVVVWLNTRTGIWHEKGMRWYGRTKHGAYVCRREAAAADYRDTENGQ
jgi:hypothetical protein